MSERKLVNFEASKEVVETAKGKLEHGEMSARLRETLERIAHGADVAEQTRIKDRLQDVREDKRQIETEMEKLRRQQEDKEREIERLEERLDTLMEQEGQYDGYLQSLDQDLQEGKSLFVGHAKIEEAARLGDCNEKDVIEDLRQRNPTIPGSQFEDEFDGVY